MVFFVIKNKENEDLIFNADCHIQSLKDNINERCHHSTSGKIALVDEEGSIINLTKNFQKAIIPNKTYKLVDVQDFGNNGVIFSPLFDVVTDEDQHLKDLIEKQNTYSAKRDSDVSQDHSNARGSRGNMGKVYSSTNKIRKWCNRVQEN